LVKQSGQLFEPIHNCDTLTKITIDSSNVDVDIDIFSAELLKRLSIASLGLVNHFGNVNIEHYRRILQNPNLARLSLEGDSIMELLSLFQDPVPTLVLETLDIVLEQSSFDAVVDKIRVLSGISHLVLSLEGEPTPAAMARLCTALKCNNSIKEVSVAGKGAEFFSAQQRHEIHQCLFSSVLNQLGETDILQNDQWPKLLAECNERHDTATALFLSIRSLAPQFDHFCREQNQPHIVRFRRIRHFCRRIRHFCRRRP